MDLDQIDSPAGRADVPACVAGGAPQALDAASVEPRARAPAAARSSPRALHLDGHEALVREAGQVDLPVRGLPAPGEDAPPPAAQGAGGDAFAREPQLAVARVAEPQEERRRAGEEEPAG